MNPFAGLSWRRLLRPRGSATLADTDPGDMGTAFGLDASMGEQNTTEPTTAPTAHRRAPWSQRLVRRPQR